MNTATLEFSQAVSLDDEPPFSSAHAALTFAFNHSAQVYDRPVMNRMASDTLGPPGKGLGGIDGAGQAGLILAKLAKMPPLHRAIITARFMPQTSPCPCCRGSVDNVQWKDAIREVSNAAVSAAMSTHLTNRVLRDAIVESYFGKKVVVGQAADAAGVSAATATNHRAMIVKWLRGTRTEKNGDGIVGEEAKAMAHISDVLSARGVCP